MPNINLAPYDARQQAIDRRRQLAAALQQESLSPIEQPQMAGVNVSPWQGAAKLAQALFAALGNRKLDKKQAELDKEIQAQRLSQALALIQAQVPGITPERAQALAQGIIAPDPMLQRFGMLGVESAIPKPGEGFSLSPGQTRFDPTGQVIANVPAPTPAQTQAGFSLSPGQTRFDASGQAIASLPPAQTQQQSTLSQTTVNVDGQPAVVLRDPQGNFFDASTKAPITGRITPYVTPPAPRQRGEITPTAEAGLVQQLNRQWNTAAKDVQDLYRANTIMDAGLQAARRGDMNAGSQAILITFQKFLDPTSVVRESEYARSGQGLAMAERIRGYVDRLAQGGAGVTLPELEKFAELAREINNRLTAEGNSLLSSERKRITGVAERYNIPAELAIPQYNYALPGGSPQGESIPEYERGPDGKLRLKVK